MSIRKEIVGGLTAFGGGLIKGIVYVMFVVVGLILIARLATADEPAHQHTELQVEALINALTNYEAAVEVDLSYVDPPDCERTNEYIQYMLERIQNEIERHPKLTYIYQPTIDYLNESWCTE